MSCSVSQLCDGRAGIGAHRISSGSYCRVFSINDTLSLRQTTSCSCLTWDPIPSHPFSLLCFASGYGFCVFCVCVCVYLSCVIHLVLGAKLIQKNQPWFFQRDPPQGYGNKSKCFHLISCSGLESSALQSRKTSDFTSKHFVVLFFPLSFFVFMYFHRSLLFQFHRW